MDQRPVGVTDSGLGGVSVLRSLTRALPQEKFIYLGDTRNAPYGDRPEEEIRRLTLLCAHRLLDKDIKALVVACNTATSAAAESLRRVLPIPVIGMEPALKPAALSGRPGKVLVMATTATLRQKKFKALMTRYGQDAILLPCPGLMEFAERGELNSAALDSYLQNRLAPLKGEKIGAAVLGCTHYVFLKEAIARALPGAALYDGNLGTARRLRSLLEQAEALSEGPGGVEFMSTDPQAVPAMRALFDLPETADEIPG